MPLNDRSSQYTARSRDLGLPGSRWSFPLALLLLRFHRLLLLQSVLFALETAFVLLFQLIIIPRLLPVLSLHRSLEFLVGLLDSSEQCQSQPALWGHPWFGHGCSHLRLGSNHLHRLPFYAPLVGCGTYGRRYRIFLLDPHSHSLRKSPLLFPFPFASPPPPPFLKVGFRSTPTFGTALTFHWCPQSFSITEGSNITSLKSSIPTPPSTSRLTRPTAPSSFLHRSPFPTASRSHLSPPPFHILSFTTASIYGPMLVVRSQNNVIFTPA